MIDERTARSLAIESIARFQAESGIPLVLRESFTVEFDDGWIFYWDSKAYLASKDFADAIAGNAPLVVFKDGSVRQAPSAFGKPSAILQWLRDNPG